MIAPTITNHAFERAKERFGMHSHVFAEWVRLTYKGWIQVNSTFLLSRNMQVAATGATYYVNHLTAECGALFVIRDNCVLTVLDFYEFKEAMPPRSILDKELISEEIPRITLMGKLTNRLANDGLIDLMVLRKLLGIPRQLESNDMKYIAAYANGLLIMADLMDVLNTKREFRDKIFLETLKTEDRLRVMGINGEIEIKGLVGNVG